MPAFLPSDPCVDPGQEGRHSYATAERAADALFNAKEA